ncbi:hypothetical protein MINS_35860 [Mycolicibacterium insubricum]|uniref:Uncharacterized protein n=1 Tax=Mycolicibacterium insubricum TaxID=444597 RepID=A0A1X0D4N0_9MYCO|nr:hypothetical protein [Mycolicibacterium insubricum]ORA67333.1 hypothetical protein BST26_15955 [Mycolicibacterium insubricum]BBZ68157.1 hypothetical protein MINS_35860 [Mycolicibacterium insubricum]
MPTNFAPIPTGRPVGAVRTVALRLAATIMLTGFGTGLAHAAPADDFDADHDIWPTAVAPAHCRSTDRTETGLQGEVTVEDRDSGRSKAGYNCNIDLLGQLQGTGAGWTSTSYRNCIYVGSTFPHTDGVAVIDASDPEHPVQTAVLTEPAMVNGTWESLKVNEKRGLLAGTGVPFVFGLGYISIYDIATDCAHPRLLNEGRGSLPGVRIPMFTHEGGFSPDGNTYWASGQAWASAVDVSDPTDPTVLWSAPAGLGSHGMDFSPDGETMYMATLAGLNILDTSAIQDRASPGVTMHQLLPMRGWKHWHDGMITQHAIPVTYDGVPYLFATDEAGSGGVKLFDASDLADLRLRNTIKLEINLPQNADRWAASSSSSGFFGYDAHYCSVDRRTDPRALACGWVQSGIRVFDVRNPDRIREIAYFNPPAQTGRNDELPNSQHVRFGGIVVPPLSGTVAIAKAILNGDINGDNIVRDGRIIGLDLSADWCMSPPEFRDNLLYVTCSDNGFLALRLDPAVYPPR